MNSSGIKNNELHSGENQPFVTSTHFFFPSELCRAPTLAESDAEVVFQKKLFLNAELYI